MAAPAHATLTYVKNPGNGKPPRVYVADNDGKHPHRIGKGRAPVVSPDGRWVAWVRPAAGRPLGRRGRAGEPGARPDAPGRPQPQGPRGRSLDGHRRDALRAGLQ